MKSELIDLNERFAQAELHGDTAFFERHLADGLRFRRANSPVPVDKATFLQDLTAPGNTNETIAASEIEVLPYGEDLAFCSLRVRFKGTRGGKPAEGTFRNSRVFVRAAGVWRCALWFNLEEA